RHRGPEGPGRWRGARPGRLRARAARDRLPEIPGRVVASQGSADRREGAGPRQPLGAQACRRDPGVAVDGAVRLLLVGVSVRALAASVASSRSARKHFPEGILALDYFGDADLLALASRHGVRVVALQRDLGPPRTLDAPGRAAPAPACGSGWRRRDSAGRRVTASSSSFRDRSARRRSWPTGATPSSLE